MNRISFHWLAFERCVFFYFFVWTTTTAACVALPPIWVVCFFPIYLLLTLIKLKHKKIPYNEFIVSVWRCRLFAFSLFPNSCYLFMPKNFQSAYFFRLPSFAPNSCSTPNSLEEQCERETKPKSTRRIPFHLELLSNCSSGFESTVQTYVRNLISVFSPAFVVGFQFQYPKTPYKFRLINVLHAVSFAHITSFILYGCVREINACHMFMKISECVLCAVWNMRYTNGKSIYRCSCIDFFISSTSSRWNYKYSTVNHTCWYVPSTWT